MESEFEVWFDDYFGGAQGEDSPYSYDDIVSAFACGFNYGRKSVDDVEVIE